MLSIFTFHCINGQTFRNYKLSVGGGAQMSPIFFFSKKIYRNGLVESIIPTVSAEMQFLPSFSLGASFSKQFQRMNLDLISPFPGLKFYPDETYKIKVNTQVSTLDFHVRKYAVNNGYMAPWGRYLDYGFCVSSYVSKLDKTIFTMEDARGYPVEISFNNDKIVSGNYYGLRLGYGKKVYSDKIKNNFVDISLTYRIMFDVVAGNLLEYNENIGDQIRTTVIRKFQNTSILNISFIYGFSI